MIAEEMVASGEGRNAPRNFSRPQPWIPAFAGMTAAERANVSIRTLRRAGFGRENLSGFGR